LQPQEKNAKAIVLFFNHFNPIHPAARKKIVKHAEFVSAKILGL